MKKRDRLYGSSPSKLSLGSVLNSRSIQYTITRASLGSLRFKVLDMRYQIK